MAVDQRAKRTLNSADKTGDREVQLATLSAILAKAVDSCDDPRVLAQLSRQYRECSRELAEVRAGSPDTGDVVMEIRARHGG